MTDEERHGQANELFAAIFPLRKRNEVLELRCIREGKQPLTSFAREKSTATSWAIRHRLDGDVYFGVGLRQEGEGRGNQAVSRLAALWADLDWKEPHTKETRDAQLAACELPPSAVVCSGHGYHCYWLLSEPTADVDTCVNIMQGIEQHFQSDHVHDPARILRVPGTTNHKHGEQVDVAIVYLDGHKRYTLGTMTGTFPYSVRSSSNKLLTPYTGGGVFTPDNAPFNVAHALSGVEEGQRDNTLYRLVCSLHRAKVPKEYAAALVKQAALNCAPPFPVDTALRKVQAVYSHVQGPNEGVAWSVPNLQSIERATLDELALREQTEIAYLPLLGQPGYLVEGWSHLVAGYPRSGKTELLAAACSEWAGMGRKVLYVTEESADIWSRRGTSRKLHSFSVAFGLGHAPESLFGECFSGDEEIIVVDTLRNLLGLKDETDNSRLAEAINPWVAAARANNKTFILAHHTRKGGGQYGEGIAGGHGLMGMFDIAIEVLRDTSKSDRRIIRAYARLITPPELLYGMEGATFKPLGSPDNITLLGAADAALAVLQEQGVWMTSRQVLDALEMEVKPSEAQLRKALISLAESAEIERIPPMGTGLVQGQTPYWHVGQGNGTNAA